MLYRRLGSAGIKVSVFSLGSWITYESQVDIDASADMIKLAYDKGINFFDNAEGYEQGNAEIVMGEALKAQPDTFGPAGRPGGLYDALCHAAAADTEPVRTIAAHHILVLLLNTLSPIWPAQNTIDGLALGEDASLLFTKILPEQVKTEVEKLKGMAEAAQAAK